MGGHCSHHISERVLDSINHTRVLALRIEVQDRNGLMSRASGFLPLFAVQLRVKGISCRSRTVEVP